MGAELTKALADKILNTVLSAMEAPGTVCGPGGMILAAAVKERVGTVHGGAARILQGECDEIAITDADAREMKGARPGYNCVIIHDGRRVGTIGITGDPQVVRGAARVAARVAQLELESQEHRMRLRTQALDGFQSVTAAAEQILAGTNDHLRLGRQLEVATSDLLAQSKVTATALGVIQDLAQRANLLGLNAAIEAARAGHSGAGFSVVAQEVRKMGERTRSSAGDIAQAIDAWNRSFEAMAEHVTAASEVAREQAQAIKAITDQMRRIELTMTDLIDG